MDDLRAGRGETWEHDPGPPRNRSWARLFAGTPNMRGLSAGLTGGERFRWPFGPVFYRGRLGDRQVRVLVVGQDGGSDEALAHRAFVGETGARVQHLLGHLGITRSYLFLNTFVYSITGQYGGWLQALAQHADSPVTRHRNRVLDYAAARNDLRLVVAVGRAARESVITWYRARGGSGTAGAGRLHLLDGTPIGPGVRLVDVVHPGAAAQGAEAEAEVATSFGAVVERVLGWVAADAAWLPADPDGDRKPAAAYAYDRSPIPLRDLPFGAPWRLGSGGTASIRRNGGRSIELGAGSRPGDAPTFPPAPGAGSDDDGDHLERGELAYEPPHGLHDHDHDRGPDRATARLLTGGRRGLPWPDFARLGVPGAATYGGGALYRGRFTGVRLLVVADQQGHDDLLWGRALTGDAGQRFQALLGALGVMRSYLIIRTLPVDTAGLPGARVSALVDLPEVVALHRALVGRVLDTNPVAAVVTVGEHAGHAVDQLVLDGQPVVSLPGWHTGSARAAWHAAHARLRSLGLPIDTTPTAVSYEGQRAPIPRADLPYGFPRWQGTSGDRALRSYGSPGGAGPPAYKVTVPRWVGDLAPEPLTAADSAALAAIRGGG
jgi:uracil-DNA glycosylase